MGWRMLTVLTVLTLLARPAPAAAQHPGVCPPGEAPTFSFGFAALKAELGPIMGEPTGCTFLNRGNGDVVQGTTTGLAVWRKATNVPTFTEGYRHWALTPGGLEHWEGSAVWEVDPPSIRGRLSPADYFPDDAEMPPGFTRSGDDQVRVVDIRLEEFGLMVGRTYRHPDGSVLLLLSAVGQTRETFARACNEMGDSLVEQGLGPIGDSPRGERGVTLRGQLRGQPARGVLFRAGAFCGGAVMAGPIVARGRADPEVSQQFEHILTLIEDRAWAHPDGNR